NPLFAIQLVRDWSVQGVLEPGPEGFALREGARPESASDLPAVWRARIGRLLDVESDATNLALELASALGQWIDGDEWRALCAIPAGPVPVAFLEILLRERVVETDERGPDVGWWFAHGMLRDAIEARATEKNRRTAHEAACATMLRARPGPDDALRFARHLAL